MIEQDGDSRDLVGLLGHADLRQRQMGVGRIGAERVQRFETLSFVVSAARSLAVDGDEDVPTRPQRVNPILEAAANVWGSIRFTSARSQRSQGTPL